jgi:glycosyltransferase involved in cell wall biosynthesis
MTDAQKLVHNLKLDDKITFQAPFLQREAPDLYRKHDIFLHTKIQDVCPGVVIEAMACGLPVVYSLSGGVPELVGSDAGVGVVTEADWEKRIPPDPKLWADAVLRVVENREKYSENARKRAVEQFDIKPWLEKHREIFKKLLS